MEKNVSSFCKYKCKSYSHFFSKSISLYAIFMDQSFNDTLTNDIISFEQLGHYLLYTLAGRVNFCQSAVVTYCIDFKCHIYPKYSDRWT